MSSSLFAFFFVFFFLFFFSLKGVVASWVENKQTKTNKQTNLRLAHLGEMDYLVLVEISGVLYIEHSFLCSTWKTHSSGVGEEEISGCPYLYMKPE